MIIELSEAFDHYTPEQWADEQSAIERLITAHANGWHLLSMSRSTAASILAHCELSALQRMVLQHHIVPQLTNIVSQARTLNYGVLCVPKTLQLAPAPNRVLLELSYFNNPDATLPAYVIVESIEGDGAFLQFLCGMLGRDLGFVSRASLTFLAGGGGSTANRYKETADSGRGVLCIVDSDRLYPGGPLGETATAVLAVDSGQPLARASVLPVREMENLIPQDVLLMVYEKNAPKRSLLLKLKEFVESASQTRPDAFDVIYGHYDIKSGVTRSFIRKLDASSFAIWKSLWSHLDPAEQEFSLEESEESKLVAAPVSTRAIAATVDYFSKTPHKCRPCVRCVRQHPFNEIVEGLVSNILSLTAAADRIRTPMRAT